MSGPARVYKWPAIAGWLAMGWLSTVAHASTEQEFAAGVAAAQRLDYAVALRHFESAERAGMREPLLYYNLGVSYYREHRLEKAEQSFQRAAKSSKLEALSYYNLGLIALDQKQHQQARAWFLRAKSVAQTEQLRNLSARALEQINRAQIVDEPGVPWMIWVAGGIGHDSNAALTGDFVNATGGEDATFGLSAYSHYDFPHLRLHALLNVEHYSEITGFDFDMLESGVSFPLQRGAWKLQPGLDLRQMRVGGEGLQNSVALLLQSRTQMADFELKFRLEHEAVSAANAFEYLDGSRDYLQTSIATSDERWRLNWDMEFNDREDLSIGNEFFSFSPRRCQWQLEYENPLSEALNIKLAAGWQMSRYPDPDRRSDGIVMQREDNRGRLSLELEYQHQNDWRSGLELSYMERNSNFAEYDYDRIVLALTMGRGFGQ
jgi:hypothetical protein